MEYDDKLIEEAVLALLATFSFDDGNTWKGYDFEAMNRLHEQGFISNPVNKNKSIWLTTEGLERGRQIADRLWAVIRLGDLTSCDGHPRHIAKDPLRHFHAGAWK